MSFTKTYVTVVYFNKSTRQRVEYKKELAKGYSDPYDAALDAYWMGIYELSEKYGNMRKWGWNYEVKEEFKTIAV